MLLLDGPNASIGPSGNSQLALASTGPAPPVGPGSPGLLALINGAALSTDGDFANGGDIRLDAAGGSGGSTLTIRGALNNSGTLILGGIESDISSSSVTAASLNNTGVISLLGFLPGATLAIGSSAPLTWIGGLYLISNSLLEFTEGSISAIGAGGTIQLTGLNERVAVAGDHSGNTALTALAENAD